jgi:hypothetical protein
MNVQLNMWALIIILMIVLLLLVLTRIVCPESFIDPGTGGKSGGDPGPAYTSGATMRVAETRVSDAAGDWWSSLGDQEGKFYARYFAPPGESAFERSQIENPTYHTATTF